MSKISDGDALAADPQSTTKDLPAAHQVYIYVVCVVYVCMCVCVCVCVCVCYIRLAQIHIKTHASSSPAAMQAADAGGKSPCYVCVLLLLYVSSYYYCPHTATYMQCSACQCLFMCPHSTIYVFSSCYICVLILLQIFPHTATYMSNEKTCQCLFKDA